MRSLRNAWLPFPGVTVAISRSDFWTRRTVNLDTDKAFASVATKNRFIDDDRDWKYCAALSPKSPVFR